MEAKKIYAKLYAIQQKVEAVKKDAKNPHFKNTYFDINSLIEHVKPLLEEQKLLIMQPLTNLNGVPAIATVFIDSESGERVEYTIPLPVDNNPQKMGSSITYYRRYALQSILFLQAEDDDGNVGAGNAPAKKQYVENFEYITKNGYFGFKKWPHKASGEMKYMCKNIKDDKPHEWYKYPGLYEAAIAKAKDKDSKTN
jgi:hypothetical protein